MKYIICNDAGTPTEINGVAGFKTIPEVSAFIEKHLETNGLDWRVGYLFKSRCDFKPFQIIIKKTGLMLNPR